MRGVMEVKRLRQVQSTGIFELQQLTLCLGIFSKPFDVDLRKNQNPLKDVMYVKALQSPEERLFLEVSRGRVTK